MSKRKRHQTHATPTVHRTDAPSLFFQCQHFWRNCNGPGSYKIVDRNGSTHVQFSRTSFSRKSCLMLWKNGIEYRGVDPAGGDRTRWDVARANPQVTISRPTEENPQTSRRWEGKRERGEQACSPLPILTTNVPGIGGTSTHSPERFCTWSPLCDDACSNYVISTSVTPTRKSMLSRTKVKKPESKWGPTPWFESTSLTAGYLTTYESVDIRPQEATFGHTHAPLYGAPSLDRRTFVKHPV